ncbi:Acylphosphatase [Candidatus Zixiibacteriota bacterium]|nr:Acylphosphatase [candidate division Zixibacteria bacterium]
MSIVGAVINVRGVVQGVGYRFWCLRRASALPIGGYVANLYDGSVEVAVEGDRGVVESFIKELKVGPSYASVTDVRVNWYDRLKGYKDFRIENKD